MNNIMNIWIYFKILFDKIKLFFNKSDDKRELENLNDGTKEHYLDRFGRKIE
jgi:hypothetical protein